MSHTARPTMPARRIRAVVGHSRLTRCVRSAELGGGLALGAGDLSLTFRHRQPASTVSSGGGVIQASGEGFGLGGYLIGVHGEPRSEAGPL